jgi:hypothetical protein
MLYQNHSQENWNYLNYIHPYLGWNFLTKKPFVQEIILQLKSTITTKFLYLHKLGCFENYIRFSELNLYAK